MEEVLQKIILEQENLHTKNVKRFNSMAFYKFLIGIFVVSSLYNFISKDFDSNYLFLSFFGMISFLYYFFLHNDIEKEMLHEKNLIAICQRHLERISGKWTEFHDIGEEFINYDHPFGCDLDIVGKKSLFQFINTTHTWHGRQRFVDDLLQSNYSTEEIIKRQEAILELSEDLMFSVEIEHQMEQIGSDDAVEKLLQQINQSKSFMENKFKQKIFLFIPFFTCGVVLLSLLLSLKYLTIFAVGCAFAQFLVWKFEEEKIDEYTSAISHLPYRLRYYNTVCDMVSSRDFNGEILKNIQSKLISSDFSTKQALNELDSIAMGLNCRTNPILHLFLNIFFLWDFRCACKLEKWKEKYEPYAESWFLALGELESLFCFALLSVVSRTATMPRILPKKEQSAIISAKKLGHPLLSESSRISNDFEFCNSILVISGSNMSGKTTFMRTVGINLILAQCGSFVCSEEMSFTPVKLVTSMRIADDLSEGISTFYAEIKRIKTILDSAESRKNTLFLIDEIFRGTNSVDRISGAETVIATLHELGVSGMITTHDLELCELESQYKRMKNHHFSESYLNKEIHFDYKMKNGKSMTTNAQYLMEMVGIKRIKKNNTN